MRKKLAIFDLDGTLFDTRRVNFLSYNAALQKFGVSLDYDVFSKECNGRHYTYFLPKLLENFEQVEEVHKAKKDCYKNFLSETKINEHLFSIIELIKSDYHIALVTTASFKNAMDILSYHKKNELFDLVLCAEDVAKKKPDAEGFLKAIDYFEVSASETLIFEDSEAGIEAAEKTGATVFVVRGFS